MPPPNLKRPRQSAVGAAAGGSATTSGSRAKRRKNDVDDGGEGSEAGGRGRGGSGVAGKGKEEDGETEGQIKVRVVTGLSSPRCCIRADIFRRSISELYQRLRCTSTSSIMISYLDGRSRLGQKSSVCRVSISYRYTLCMLIRPAHELYKSVPTATTISSSAEEPSQRSPSAQKPDLDSTDPTIPGTNRESSISNLNGNGNGNVNGDADNQEQDEDDGEDDIVVEAPTTRSKTAPLRKEPTPVPRKVDPIITLSDIHMAREVLAERANAHWQKGLGGGQNKEGETIVNFLYKLKVGPGKPRFSLITFSIGFRYILSFIISGKTAADN
jgi:hypothetical protein